MTGKFKVCPNPQCMANNAEDSIFCAKCGSKLSPAPISHDDSTSSQNAYKTELFHYDNVSPQNNYNYDSFSGNNTSPQNSFNSETIQQAIEQIISSKGDMYLRNEYEFVQELKSRCPHLPQDIEIIEKNYIFGAGELFYQVQTAKAGEQPAKIRKIIDYLQMFTSATENERGVLVYDIFGEALKWNTGQNTNSGNSSLKKLAARNVTTASSINWGISENNGINTDIFNAPGASVSPSDSYGNTVKDNSKLKTILLASGFLILFVLVGVGSFFLSRSLAKNKSTVSSSAETTVETSTVSADNPEETREEEAEEGAAAEEAAEEAAEAVAEEAAEETAEVTEASEAAQGKTPATRVKSLPPTDQTEEDSEAEEESETEEIEEVQEPASAQVIVSYPNLDGYKEINMVDCYASSVINQSVKYHQQRANGPEKLLDHDSKTNWQEGVNGLGIGEYLEFYFGKEMLVKYIRLDLGCWNQGDYGDDRYYIRNGTPDGLLITIGDFQQEVYFKKHDSSGTPDWIELSQEVSGRSIRIEIISVRKGSYYKGDGPYSDTVITGLEVYGREKE